MATSRTWWTDLGFGVAPERRTAPESNGLTVYRAWGGSSTEWGSGFFSLEKPTSVLDAELRFNIVDWGNLIRFVSTFRILSGVTCYVGPVAHAEGGLRKTGTQVWIEKQNLVNVRLIRTAEPLAQDAHVLVPISARRTPWN